MRLNLPLVVLPTALSVAAFLTFASGIRRDGCVYYIETKTPETLILELEVIACAPQSIRAAGITDVMSIATGSWDWEFAHERGKNPAGMDFTPWVYDNAQSILNGVLDCAEAAGRGDRQGLKTLYDCLPWKSSSATRWDMRDPKREASITLRMQSKMRWAMVSRMAIWSALAFC